LILGEPARMTFRHFLCGEKRILAECRQTHHEWWATPLQVGFWKIPFVGMTT
jgi:hypothetical protein